MRESIRFDLDDIACEVALDVESGPDAGLHLLSAKLHYGGGETEEIKVRYDTDKRWIIDPLLQDHQRNEGNSRIYDRMSHYVEELSLRLGSYYDRGLMRVSKQ